MLKIERDKLLVTAVLFVIISIDMINTSMLAPVLPSIPNFVPFFAIMLLAVRFLYIRNYSLSFLIFAPTLILVGSMVYYKAGNLNGLMFLLLIVFLYKADLESILKIYTWTSLSFIVLIILLSLVNVIPNLQFVQTRPVGVVVRNSFGFIYPTDFASHCFYLFTALSYLLRKKFIFLRTLSGVALAAFIIVYCDARLNAGSILAATGIFLYFYYRNKTEWRLFSLLPFSAGIASSVMIYLSNKFSWSHPIYVSLNNFFSMRLHLGHEALKKYGIELFGIRGISFTGYGGKTETVLNYDYVDSSYVQMLFTYGMIPVVILICFYIFQSWKLYRCKEYLLLTILSLVAFNCMFEAFWVRPSYNIFMFLLFATIPAMDFEGEKSEMREAV
ncbi:polysaccharide polymerase [Streptococcus oralis]|jgi:polysaccharide polymerase|uniref:polysaccharide polymerase n=1 Tax=Streptococcus oralis TaxID=1303 RepID=UPI000C7B3BAC|nr:polysaccharide polymerase [Streptococcus oralis]MBK3297779.1 polysaccharide polymerase [Streptococcus oralis]MBR8666461.1 polysaccharide polymerase [Streptococcus oralis]MDB6219683.1 polysaccharide polymerase [Streptococcus oralis]MDU3458414.1 polysaccharide polymerase [Streptococcus oralis]PLA07807.1 polysaccharide polymerase [Streptococcus oralis subsp. dentisani]